jgi:hypothetical protein
MSKKKQYNNDEIINRIRSTYKTNKEFNVGFGHDKWLPFSPDLDVQNLPNYTKKNKIMVCKLEDVQFLLLQGHPISNIVYIADNHVRETNARSGYGVTTCFYTGLKKDKQQMLRIRIDYKDKIDHVIFRNRATNTGDNFEWTRYKKIAYDVAKENASISITAVPMALSIETRDTNHDVVAFSMGKLEKHAPDKGGYVAVHYIKNSKKGIKPKILKPIDPKNKLDHGILEKVLEPNSFDWFHNSKSQTDMEKRKTITYNGKLDTIIRLTGNANQPFEYGNVNHKDVRPAGLWVIASKEHKQNPASCIATTEPNYPHISYSTTHDSWKVFPDAQLMARYFLNNPVKTFFCKTLGLKHRTYFCFWKAFNVNEIKVSTDHPASYKLDDKEKQYLDSI